MLRNCTLFGTLLLLCACNAQNKLNSQSEKEAGNAQTTLLPDNNTMVDDPYFTITDDTIATRGPISITRNIIQDKRGHYWFATWQGIMRYDGKYFTNHTLKDGLKKFHVFAALEDSRGFLWFGMIGGGLYRHDPSNASAKKDGGFTRFSTSDGLVDDVVLSMLEDRDGNIWIGTTNGVSMYNSMTNQFTNYTVDDGLCGPEVNGIAQDTAGAMWFATRGGADSDLCNYREKKFTIITQSDGSRFFNVRHVLEDRKGNMWFGGQDGLWHLETATLDLTQRIPNFIGYIYEDSKGIIWLSHGEMKSPKMFLTRLDPNAARSTSMKEIHSDQQVFGIIEDKDGDIWFGTPSGAKRYNALAGVILDL